jgi:hypothetical protein
VDRTARQAEPAWAADPVRLEIETALRKNKPLIPVLVSRAVMPVPEQLPESLHDFACDDDRRDDLPSRRASARHDQGNRVGQHDGHRAAVSKLIRSVVHLIRSVVHNT